MRSCFTCVFWTVRVRLASDGRCQRYPPPWHQTLATDLCGEHRAVGEERRSDFWPAVNERLIGRVEE